MNNKEIGKSVKEDLQSIEFRKAMPEDIDLLVRTRIEMLREVNGLTESADMSKVERQCRDYYEKALADAMHTALLVFDQGHFIGAGGISYYRVMPTYCNPTGRKAYIANMYTRPEYRRKGIAFHTLNLLVQDARERGITSVSLEAVAAGRSLYEKYGFSGMKDEMQLIL